jgi:hypothetical protein
MNGWINRLALTTFLVTVSPLTNAEEMPSGTITFNGGAIAVGVGYTWGTGTLVFQEKNYPFSLDGLSIVDVGAAEIEGAGDVYNIMSPAQFSGNYVAAGIGATIAGGGSVVALRNQNGVVIRIHTTQQGLKFNLSASGVSIQLKAAE